MIKISCVGSIKYENKRKIKEYLYKLLQRYGNKFEIITRGNKNGAEKYIKKYALEFGISYGEYNPAYTSYNIYSKFPVNYYDKLWAPRMDAQNNAIIAKESNAFIIFQNEDEDDRQINHLIKQIRNLGKPYKIIN